MISILRILVSAKNQPGKVLQLTLQNHVAAIVECETTSSWISLLLNCGCVFDRKEKLTPSSKYYKLQMLQIHGEFHREIRTYKKHHLFACLLY